MKEFWETLKKIADFILWPNFIMIIVIPVIVLVIWGWGWALFAFIVGGFFSQIE